MNEFYIGDCVKISKISNSKRIITGKFQFRPKDNSNEIEYTYTISDSNMNWFKEELELDENELILKRLDETN